MAFFAKSCRLSVQQSAGMLEPGHQQVIQLACQTPALPVWTSKFLNVRYIMYHCWQSLRVLLMCIAAQAATS